MTTASETVIIPVDAPVEFERVKTILAKEGGRVAFIQLQYNLPVIVASDELEQRIAVVFLHLLSERDQIDSKIREFCLNLAQKASQDIDHSIVSDSYKLVLILTLALANSTQESEEEFMAKVVLGSLSKFFERKTGLIFKL